ncbi:hypothetical protein [Burkholderia sp. Nafp2/4-1b]|uniref:hypothetical protein n=1 Tax=Burkholderia sp. Nafp2/4-1b TaxID=2116686 RepID=UPI001F09479B|nr:hypothetical protein [Burkholderia sp. Nafp2/4-1b]
MDEMTKWKIMLADNWRTLHRRGTVIVSGALAIVTAAGRPERAIAAGCAALRGARRVRADPHRALHRGAPRDAAAGQGTGDGAQ